MQPFLSQLLHVPVGEAEQSLPALPARLGGPKNRQVRVAKAMLMESSVQSPGAVQAPQTAATLQGLALQGGGSASVGL